MPKVEIKLMRFLSCGLLTLFALSALAKPMPSASLQEGVTVSPTIVVAKFRSLRPNRVDYLSGATTSYEIVKVLKGKAPSDGLLTVRYDFHDGSACLEPPGWAFSPKMMPKAGSEWILLLQPPGTYRGDFGRLAATEENLKRVKRLLGAGR